jgi:predicted nucleotidyltransferase
MEPTRRWRELLQERLDEAIAVLGAVPGVRGLIIGGSMGRGDPWPLSDIDLLPVYATSLEPAREVQQRHAALIDWWAASGRAQTLDVGWLAFTDDEIRAAVLAGPAEAAARMTDRRWFHGIDKAFGGRAAADPSGLAQTFLDWVTAIRFDPLVVAARVRQWWQQALTSQRTALAAVADQDPSQATYLLREAARALRLVLVEGWGERLGSMGREWTRFERLAGQRGAQVLAARVAALAGADPGDAARRAELAPAWLKERIELAAAARRLIGEQVTPQENARDQLAAFSVHVARHRPDLAGPWTGSPDPALAERLAELEQVMATLRQDADLAG